MNDQDIELDYGYLTQNALRRVIYEALKVTEALGDTPGEHHFYIEFLTSLPGVTLSAALKASYPDSMTIVLQHSFADLEVTDEAFAVTLKFGGVPERLHIPFEAITSFEDPSVQFGLRFESFAAQDPDTLPDRAPGTGGGGYDDSMGDDSMGDDSMGEDSAARHADGAGMSKPSSLPADPQDPPISADIVSLDRFRKD